MTNRRRGALVSSMLLALVAGLAACTAASTPLPPVESSDVAASASTSASPANTLSALQSPTVSPPASPSPTPTPTPTPTPRTVFDAPPVLGPVPAGTWTGIKWVAISPKKFPAVPTTLPGQGGSGTVEGWSKGFVDFVWNPHVRALTPWVSPDGLSWTVGHALDLAVWWPEFKGMGLKGYDSCTFTVTEFQEGPTNLLMRGFVTCPYSCAGGTGGNTSDAMWVSPDGVTWTPVDLKAAFGVGGARRISGGSSGYITLGSVGKVQVDWVSTDGQTWVSGTLPTSGRKYGDPVSYAGGVLFPGTLYVSKGRQEEGGKCGPSGITDYSKFRGAVWWSPDGLTWTLSSLGGVVTPGAEMSMARVDDNTLVGVETNADWSSFWNWGSKDGKSWKYLAKAPCVGGGDLSSRDHGLCETADGTLYAMDPQLSYVKLVSSGDLPGVGSDWVIDHRAVGPTGVIWVNTSSAGGPSQYWIGIPSAG